MTRVAIAGGTLAAVFVGIAVVATMRAYDRGVTPFAATSAPAAAAPAGATGAPTHHGLIYGRVTLDNGDVHEGRLRWGADEEALWSNYFNGVKSENPWIAHAPRQVGRLAQDRPFMARFGDITRINPSGREVRVTLKSGTVVDLDRFSADDLADGVRVWDETGGGVDIGEWRIRSVEFLPDPGADASPRALYGTVHTRQGDFSGLIQWDREAALVSDELRGRAADGELGLRFDDIRSIARRSGESSLVTLRDGREIVLADTRAAGSGNRGLYVDDHRYGRVLVSWDAFERIDFDLGGNAPAYHDFTAGSPLTGGVVTRSGERLVGRLVFDLDESETTETLDAPWDGVDYTIPFGLVASIVVPGPEASGPRHASVTLHSGEQLLLERGGDLGEGNAGMLIFAGGPSNPEYVPWADVARIDLDRAAAMYPAVVPR